MEEIEEKTESEIDPAEIIDEDDYPAMLARMEKEDRLL